MATIKEILDAFCEQKNIPKPSSYVGSTNPAALQYLALLRKVGDLLVDKPYNWPQLKRGHIFTTATDQRRYQLPGDFNRLLSRNQWDTTNQWPLTGPLTDSRFTAREYAVVSTLTNKAYRLIGPVGYLYSVSPFSQRSVGSFEIDPPGDNDTDELFMGYLSGNWIWPRSWVTATNYAAGSVRAGDGYVYYTAAGGVAGATRPSHSSGSASDGTVTWTVYKERYPLLSSNSLLHDDDQVLFDTDLMIDGVYWAWLQAKKQGWQEEYQIWDNAVSVASSRFTGPAELDLTQCSEFPGLDFPRSSEGGWDI